MTIRPPSVDEVSKLVMAFKACAQDPGTHPATVAMAAVAIISCIADAAPTAAMRAETYAKALECLTGLASGVTSALRWEGPIQ